MIRRFMLTAGLLLGLHALPTGAAETAYPVPPEAPVVPYTRFSIQYSVRDISGAGPKSIEFYITEDMGRTWRRYGEDPDAKSPMLVNVPGDGVYGFMTVGTDFVGNSERPPVGGTRPETVIVVDRTPPTARWILPDSTSLLGADGVTLQWEAQDRHMGGAPVAIEHSPDGGLTWLPLKDRLPATGQYVWQPTSPAGGSISFRMLVRDLAGNRLILGCPHRLLTDTIPPTINPIGPAQSAQLSVNLNYVVSDNPGGSGVGRVTLYQTTDNGQTWRRYGDDPDARSPMTFSSELAGPVGLMLVATDHARNVSRLPRAGEQPQFMILFDNEPPLVRFDPQLPTNDESPTGAAHLRGEQDVAVAWKATDSNLKPQSAKLEFSSDAGETWSLIEAGLSAVSAYTWKVPKLQSETCLLRVSVADALGNVGTANTLQFGIKSVVPVTTITDVQPIADSGPAESTGMGAAAAVVPEARVEIKDDVEVPPLVSGTIPEVDTATVNRLTDRPAPSVDNIPDVPPAPPLPTPDDRPPAVPSVPVMPTTTLGEIPPAVTVPDVPAATPPAAPASSGPSSDWTDSPAAGDMSSVPTTPPPTVTPVETAPTPVSALPAAPAVPDLPPPPSGDGSEKLVRDAEGLFREGRGSQALELALRAVDTSPQYAPGLDLIARIHYTDGDFEKAVAHSARAVSADRNEPAYWHNLGEASYSLARQYSRQLLERMRSSDATPQALSELARQRDDAVNQARSAFSQVTRMAPRQKKGFARLGDTIYMQARLMEEQDSARAGDFYREAIDAYKASFEIGQVGYRETFQLGVSHYRLYNIARDTELLREAQRYLERAIEEAPQEVRPKEAFWYLAEIHQELNQPENAIRYWEEVLRAYPEGSKFHSEAKDRLAELQGN